MPDVKVDAVVNQADYNRGYNGSALKVILLAGYGTGKILSIANIVGRGQNFTYDVQYPVSQADEINTTFVQETNHGRQELGSGRIAVVFNLQANDQMPYFDNIRTAPEGTILEVTGDDHPMTVNGIPTILHAFEGVRIVGIGSGAGVGQQKMLDVSVIFRKRTPGKVWILNNSATVSYPATPTK
jgi:TusA-related sulfurtransferase